MAKTYTATELQERKIELHKTIGASVAAQTSMSPAGFVEKVTFALDLSKHLSASNYAKKYDAQTEIFKGIAANAIAMAQSMGDSRSAEEISKKLTEVYISKNHDYGDSFGLSYQEYGMMMPCIRIEDKLRRFNSLAVNKRSALVLDEKIADTLIDLANYAILTAIELQVEKEMKEGWYV